MAVPLVTVPRCGKPLMVGNPELDPYMTYAIPTTLPEKVGSAPGAPITMSSKPSPFTSPAPATEVPSPAFALVARQPSTYQLFVALTPLRLP